MTENLYSMYPVYNHALKVCFGQVWFGFLSNSEASATSTTELVERYNS